jgi:hypothetical protein
MTDTVPDPAAPSFPAAPRAFLPPWAGQLSQSRLRIAASISYATPLAYLAFGFFLSGTALPIVSFLGFMAAAGALAAIVALIGARRANNRPLVVVAAIGLALNTPFLLWTVRFFQARAAQLFFGP